MNQAKMFSGSFFDSNNKKALFSGLFTALFLFLRNILLLALYSYAFYPDSNLYVQLGKTFFKTGTISTLVMFPYPLLNALTDSYRNPYFLIWMQMLFVAMAGGLLVYIIARKNLILACVVSMFLAFDLVWGSMSLAILTDGMFATFFMFSLAVLLWHYDQHVQLKSWVFFLSGVLYGFTIIIRPSHIFLAFLLPGVYLWLTRSWKKTLAVSVGLLTVFGLVGLINLRGYGKFFIFASGSSYTDVNTAFPLFVYGLFSPGNGPVSKQVDNALQQCYPGLDYQASVERSEGGAVDSSTNMAFVHRKILPCLVKVMGGDWIKGKFPRIYLEAFKSNPEHFIKVMYQENNVFLRYNNPYVLRWNLSASNDYGCEGIPWCESIRRPQFEWTTGSPIYMLYEKAASKILQAYLAPVGIITRLSPEKIYLPYTIVWLGMIAFVLLAMRGRNLFLALSIIIIIQFTSMVVVAGHGFTERYASMLAPLQTTLSALVYYTLAEQIMKIFRRLKKQASPEQLGTV
jgi:hypothetical protein